MLKCVKVSPATATSEAGMTAPFTFGSADQFGNLIAGTSAAAAGSWSLASGGGRISTSGIYPAPATAGSATITASAPGLGSGSATVSITNSLALWYKANATGGN